MANGRCRQHGGKSLRGIAHPNYQGKGYARDLPTRMVARYKEAIKDTELLNLSKEIALVDARLADLLVRVDSGEAGELWRALQTVTAVMQATRGLDSEESKLKFAESLDQIGILTREGIEDYAAWRELGDVVEQRRKLVESERKRRVDMQNMITADGAMLMISRIANIIREHVKDRTILSAISDDISRLVTREPVGAIATGSAE